MKRVSHLSPLIAGALFALPCLAHAEESPKWTSFELGGGVVAPTGDVVQSVYGKDPREPAFHARAGVLLFSVVDIGVAADFAQITGRRQSGTGVPSADVSRLTLVPMSATAIARLDFLNNQWVVPYGGGGFAYLVWSERSPYADEQVDGDKYGWTALGGVQILLDVLEPARAADLDGFWGVNDTYLNLELSRTEYDRLGKGVDGLDFAHWSARASIMFEY